MNSVSQSRTLFYFFLFNFIFQDRYVFCYKTILAYLDSFNAYSNFADC